MLSQVGAVLDHHEVLQGVERAVDPLKDIGIRARAGPSRDLVDLGHETVAHTRPAGLVGFVILARLRNEPAACVNGLIDDVGFGHVQRHDRLGVGGFVVRHDREDGACSVVLDHDRRAVAVAVLQINPARRKGRGDRGVLHGQIVRHARCRDDRLGRIHSVLLIYIGLILLLELRRVALRDLLFMPGWGHFCREGTGIRHRNHCNHDQRLARDNVQHFGLLVGGASSLLNLVNGRGLFNAFNKHT